MDTDITNLAARAAIQLEEATKPDFWVDNALVDCGRNAGGASVELLRDPPSKPARR